MVELVGPGDGQELLPPAGRHEGDVEAKHKGERDECEESIKVLDNAFKEPVNGVISMWQKERRTSFAAGS